MVVVVVVVLAYLWIGLTSMDGVAVYRGNMPSMDGMAIGRKLAAMRRME